MIYNNYELYIDDDDIQSDQGDLNNCEFLVNLQVWHTKLCHELYGKKKDKKHRKSSSGFFGK